MLSEIWRRVDHWLSLRYRWGRLCAWYQCVLLGTIVHPQKSEAYIFTYTFIMMLRTVTLCWFLVAVASAPSSSKSNEDFDLNIVEQGTHFTDEVEVDVERNVEQLEVPPHNDIMGAECIHDFNRHLTLRLTTGSEHCFLSDLSRAIQDGYAVQLRELLSALRHAKDHPPENGVTIVVNHWAIGDRVREEDVSLSPEMRRLCLGRAIYWLQHMDDSVSVGSHPHNESHLNRHRRQSFTTCQLMNNIYRCKRKVVHCGYSYYDNCYPSRGRWRGTQLCENDNNMHFIDEVTCCRECCLDQSQADGLLPFCNHMNDFTCTES